MNMIVRQISGLGNQLFQYAAGRYYARQHQAQMRMAIDPPERAVSHGHPRPFLLAHFAIRAQYHELSRFERLMLVAGNRRLQPAAGAILRQGLHLQVVSEGAEQRFHFQPALAVSGKTRTVYLVGYWQVHGIADAIAPELREEFALREEPTGMNAEVLGRIQNSASPVSLHIRRGDYTLDVEGNVALPMDYYAQAIRRIQESVHNPTFFVFSDDMEFARKNLSRDIRAVFVDHNDSFMAHEDLRLMSACRHHIIANSTFSWWGAWLSPCQDKIVIAPRRWMVANRQHYEDLFPPSWQLLA